MQNQVSGHTKCSDLEKLLQEYGYLEKEYVTETEIKMCLNDWVKTKLAYSTLNKNYANAVAWLVA
jgi:hypothetical protein